MEAVSIREAGDFFAEDFDGFGDFADLVGVEGEFDRWEASYFEGGCFVFFDVEVAGDAGGKDDDFVATFCETDG